MRDVDELVAFLPKSSATPLVVNLVAFWDALQRPPAGDQSVVAASPPLPKAQATRAKFSAC